MKSASHQLLLVLPVETCSLSAEKVFKSLIQIWNSSFSSLTTEGQRLHYFLKKYFISFQWLFIFSREFSYYSKYFFLICTLSYLKENSHIYRKKYHIRILYQKHKQILHLHSKIATSQFPEKDFSGNFFSHYFQNRKKKSFNHLILFLSCQ